MLKRFMGVALTLILLFATSVNFLHTHADDHDHVEDESISSLELEADCSLCDQLAPSVNRLVKKVHFYFPPQGEHNTPLSSQSFERPESKTIATLLLAPKTSPPTFTS